MAKLKAYFVRIILRAMWRVHVRITGYTYKPVCPWCGADCPTDPDGRECWRDGDVEEIECFSCGREYERHVDVSITFFTEKTDA